MNSQINSQPEKPLKRTYGILKLFGIVFVVFLGVLAVLYTLNTYNDTPTKNLGRGFYFVEGNLVYVLDKCVAIEWLETGHCARYSTKKLIEADKNSFQIFEKDPYYAKDKNHVYLVGKIVENVDAVTFQVLEFNYMEDKNGIYYTNTIFPIDTVMGVSFSDHLNSILVNGKDAQKIADNDGAFTVMNGHVNDENVLVYFNYAKNDKNVFYKGKILANADARTFHMFNKCYFADSKNIYLAYDLQIKNVDYSTLKEVEKSCIYLKDKNFVFNSGKILVGAHPKTFTLAKDENH